MDDLLYYSLTLAVCLAAILFLSPLRGKQQLPPLPPGPPWLMWLLTPLLFLDPTNLAIERVILAARSRYGPVFTLHLLPSRPSIFIADRAVAHRALVQRGAAFADRPPPSLSVQLFSSDQHNISSSRYGPLWRALRQNLTGGAFHPVRLRQYAGARRRAASGLVAAVKAQMDREGVVVVQGLLQRAVLRVVVAMCFGDGLDNDDTLLASIEALHREFATTSMGFQVFVVCPAVTKVLFRRRWKRMLSLRRRQEEVFVPLIRARRESSQDAAPGNSSVNTSYVDSLLGLRIPEGSDGDGDGRNLTEGEMVSLCFEFLTASIDSTSAVAQWIMANLVAQPEIQARLRAEIHQVTGAHVDHIQDEDMRRMPYLRAVVLEALRRHPPGHFLLPHAVVATEIVDQDGDGDGYTTIEGFRVPRHASVNVTVAGIGLDDAVWPDARRFRPERFLPSGEGVEGASVNLTGAKDSKLMPFGTGRRICPGMPLALLHLQFFVACLVAEFKWLQVAGEPVEFAEKQELTILMQRPLRARVVPCNC